MEALPDLPLVSDIVPGFEGSNFYGVGAPRATPADIMRVQGAGTLGGGGPADFVVFRGRSWTELLSRPESERIVVRDGKPIERVIPDYAELDELMV